jgi:hypothetical protein
MYYGIFFAFECTSGHDDSQCRFNTQAGAGTSRNDEPREVRKGFMDKESSENRRKERRTAVDENVYVVIDTQPEMMGQMVEISSTGMAFTFVDLDSVSQRLKGRDVLRMDFFAAGKGYFIRNLPARLVSTTDTPSANAISSLMIKRIGVEFTSLSVSQQVQVNSLIRRQNERGGIGRTNRRHGDA